MVSPWPNTAKSKQHVNHHRYHYKCLKIARGKVKEDDKYTCPICDWRMKIPRDASRPKLEDLISLAEEISTLPFQPEEEDVLRSIIDNSQTFRDHISRYCNPLLSTEAEAETQRFYLRKLEGAEVLLSFETNFFRQELHKWCPVAPEPPPILEVSLSTRKPRPTKLQKMLVEYGVENPDDLPEHAKGKANSLRRKAANAEAAAAAAYGTAGGLVPPSPAFGGPPYHHGSQPSAPGAATSHSHPERPHSPSESTRSRDSMNYINANMHPALLGAGGPQLVVDNSSLTLEERLLQGVEDDINLQSDAGKTKALEILARTDLGRKQAEKIFGPEVWQNRGSMSEHERSLTPRDIEEIKADDGKVDEMFKEMTHQDDDEDGKKKDAALDGAVTAESFEKERSGLDALLDGE
jgi:histone demethylase JARID1